MLETVLARIPCEQSACNAIDVAIEIAYAVAVTTGIVVIITYIRKKRSDTALK